MTWPASITHSLFPKDVFILDCPLHGQLTTATGMHYGSLPRRNHLFNVPEAGRPSYPSSVSFAAWFGTGTVVEIGGCIRVYSITREQNCRVNYSRGPRDGPLAGSETRGISCRIYPVAARFGAWVIVAYISNLVCLGKIQPKYTLHTDIYSHNHGQLPPRLLKLYSSGESADITALIIKDQALKLLFSDQSLIVHT